MTDYPYEGEVQLLGYAWNPDDGPWIRIRLDEIAEMSGGPHPFNGLKKGREKGQRLRMRFDLIADDETTTGAPAEPAGEVPEGTPTPQEPVKGGARAKRAWDDVSPREQACIRCNEAEFGTWLRQYLHADAQNNVDIPVLVRTYCGVNSRSELLPDSTGARFWAVLDEEYQDYIGQQRYDALETQRDGGPG